MSFAKKVVGATGIITLAGVGARLLSFVSVPVLSHLLGPGPYGVVALAGSVVALGSIIALFGMDVAYGRYYLLEERDQRAAVEHFCWGVSHMGALVVATAVGAGWYWLGQRWLPECYQTVALYSFFAIVMSVALSMSNMRVRLGGNYRKLAFAPIVGALVSLAVSLGVAMYWRADAMALILGALAGMLATLVLLGLPAKLVFFSQSSLPANKKWAVLALGAPVTITAPMFWVVASSDRWFLAEYTTEAVIGVYSMAGSVALLGMILNTSISSTWFPEASRLYGEQKAGALAPLGELWERLVVGIAIAWLAVAAAGGDLLRLLAAPQFHSGAAYIPLLAAGIFFYGLFGLINPAFVLARKMRYVVVVWIVGAAINIGLNLWLVPRLAAQGAALAQCLSYGLIALCLLAASRSILPMPIHWKRLGLCLLMVVAAGVIMSPAWADNPLLSLLAKFPTGLLMSILLVRVIAPDWYRRAFIMLA